MSSKIKFDPDQYPYLECREQHVWKPYDGTINHKEKTAERVQKCKNCPTKRFQTLSMRVIDYGMVVKSSYSYPTDYQIKGGLGRAERGVIRMYNFMDSVSE